MSILSLVDPISVMIRDFPISEIAKGGVNMGREPSVPTLFSFSFLGVHYFNLLLIWWPTKTQKNIHKFIY